jgi:predicted esterase
MNARVGVRFYPGMGHMVSTEEIESVREIVEAI